MHLFHDHAPGWQFHLAHYVDSSHVWKAPNGTAYVVGYFSGPNGSSNVAALSAGHHGQSKQRDCVR